jgi:hypothetical protein
LFFPPSLQARCSLALPHLERISGSRGIQVLSEIQFLAESPVWIRVEPIPTWRFSPKPAENLNLTLTLTLHKIGSSWLKFPGYTTRPSIGFHSGVWPLPYVKPEEQRKDVEGDNLDKKGHFRSERSDSAFIALHCVRDRISDKYLFLDASENDSITFFGIREVENPEKYLLEKFDGVWGTRGLPAGCPRDARGLPAGFAHGPPAKISGFFQVSRGLPACYPRVTRGFILSWSPPVVHGLGVFDYAESEFGNHF